MAIVTVKVSLAPDCAHLILADGRSSIQTVVEVTWVRKRSSINEVTGGQMSLVVRLRHRILQATLEVFVAHA